MHIFTVRKGWTVYEKEKHVHSTVLKSVKMDENNNCIQNNLFDLPFDETIT